MATRKWETHKEAHCRRGTKEAQGVGGEETMVLHGLSVKHRYTVTPLEIF